MPVLEGLIRYLVVRELAYSSRRTFAADLLAVISAILISGTIIGTIQNVAPCPFVRVVVRVATIRMIAQALIWVFGWFIIV